MAYRIKVQDGIISYSATDPDDLVTYDIHGTLNVRTKINIGEDNSPISTISSTKDIVVNSGSIGAVRLEPDSKFIFLNGVSWPVGTTGIIPGMYIGASASNTLEYQRFIIGTALSDNETSQTLSSLYPDAQPGQSVSGPSVLYTCVAPSQWRILGFGQVIIGTVNSDTLTSAELELLFPSASPGQMVAGPTVIYIFAGEGWRRIGSPESEGLIVVKSFSEDYTLEISDAKNTLITIDSPDAHSVFIPEDSTVNLPVGSAVLIGRNGDGAVTIVAEAGVTIRTPDTYNIGKKYGKVTVIKVAANTWELEGNLEPA